MSFKIKNNSIHAIAKTNMAVYMIGKRTPKGFQPIVYDKLVYTSETFIPKLVLDCCNTTITRGYHAYDLATAGRLINNNCELCIAKFSIPVGSEFYYGQANRSKTVRNMQYVSNIISFDKIL